MISVCIASFNGEKFIEEQVRSILNQLSNFDEVVVSDDGSTDSTLEILNSINDARIRIVRNATPRGYTSNFENAIKSSRGELIFLSDQDDVWIDGRVQEMSFRLQKSDFVICDAKFVSDSLSPLGITYFELRGGGSGFARNIIKLRYLGACMAFRRHILKKVLPFPTRRDLCTHDLWLALVAEFYYKVDVIVEPYILYRRHGANVSSGGVAIGSNFFWKIKYRAYVAMMIFGRIFK